MKRLIAAGVAALAVSLSGTVSPAHAAGDTTTFSPQAGIMNWDFVSSFRTYVGSTPCLTKSDEIGGCEDLQQGVSTLEKSKTLRWELAENQPQIDTANPTSLLHFGGSVHWKKYGGTLEVTLSNPTIDLANKKLLVDVQSNGTMSDATPVKVTQEALLNLADLQIEARENYLVLHSMRPVITDLSKRAFGFYSGQVRQPLVVVIKAPEISADAQLPEPELWNVFPEKYSEDTPPPLSDPEEPIKEVNIPDPTLRQCIVKELEEESALRKGVPILNKHLDQLQSFSCIGFGREVPVKSLEGLQYAKNLSSLRVNRNEISDLSPLEGLPKLVSIDVGYNKLHSLRGLGSSPKLTTIAAEHNEIDNLDPLKNLSGLQKLDVYENALVDISGLPEMSENLENINLSYNKISDISIMSKVPYLSKLNLRHNKITDPSPLSNLRVVTNVDLRDNYIADFSSLTKWKDNADSLSRLYLGGNKTDDLSAFRWLGSKLHESDGDFKTNPNTLKYDLSVVSGSSSESEYEPGATVELVADAPVEGMVFEKWVGDGISFADSTKPETTFVMPNKFVKVEARYVTKPNVQTAGILLWGLKSSFRDYIKNGAAHGDWTLSNETAYKKDAEGLSGFEFQLEKNQNIDLNSFAGANYKGTVRFKGHGGMLDLTIADPQIVKTNESWKLTALVASKPLAKVSSVAAGVPAAAPSENEWKPVLERLTFANLSNPVVKDNTILFENVTIDQDAVSAMGNFYAVGTELDSVLLSFGNVSVSGVPLVLEDEQHEPANISTVEDPESSVEVPGVQSPEATVESPEATVESSVEVPGVQSPEATVESPEATVESSVEVPGVQSPEATVESSKNNNDDKANSARNLLSNTGSSGMTLVYVALILALVGTTIMKMTGKRV